MEWLKKNYEKAALGLVIVILLASAAFIILGTMDFPALFADQKSSKPPNNTIKPLPTEALTVAVQNVKQPRNWTSHDGSLLVSRLYILKDSLIDPLESDTPLHDPIKNSWLTKYELPYWEGDIKEQDTDGDGFSNLDEFLANTDPRDKKSVPPYYTKLRLNRFIAKPFRLKFTGTPDDGQTFTINTKDRGKTQFLELGQMIEGAPYKVLTYQKKQETKNDIEVDTSELTIENTETGQKLALVYNQEANDPTSFGEFLYLYDNSTFTVKKDDDFVLAPETNRKYKLIDISEAGAVIKDLQTGEQHKISLAQ